MKKKLDENCLGNQSNAKLREESTEKPQLNIVFQLTSIPVEWMNMFDRWAAALESFRILVQLPAKTFLLWIDIPQYLPKHLLKFKKRFFFVDLWKKWSKYAHNFNVEYNTKNLLRFIFFLDSFVRSSYLFIIYLLFRSSKTLTFKTRLCAKPFL